MMRKIFSWVLGLILLASPVILQAQITTGTLRGFVTDENAEPLPGVVIEIESTALMTPRSGVTDARGAYRFLYLPPGKYTICVKMEGFETCWVRGVPVRVSMTSTANIKLKIGTLEETIEVTAEAPVIDKETSARSYNITKELIDTIPFAPRQNFNASWISLPGVSGWFGDSPIVNAALIIRNVEPGKSYYFSTGGGGGTAYQDDSYENKILIDGMDIQDTMSGLNYFQLNNESVQEMDVKTAGAPAEYGNARSAFMNVITKTGGNKFEGAFLFQYQPRSFVTTNIEGTSSKMESYAIPSITLSGPIMKDKVWFLASYKYDNEDYQYPNTLVVEKIVRKTRSHMPYLKLTLQPHASHTLSFVYMNNARDINLGAFPSSVRSTLEAAQTRKRGGPMYSTTWRWVVSDSMYFNFLAGNNVQVQDNLADNPLPRLYYTSKYRGTTERYDQGYGEDYYSTRANALISGDLTWFQDDLWNTGAHEFKFGVEIRPRGYVERTRKYWEDQYGFYRYYYGLDYENYGLSEPYLWQAREAFPGNEYINEYVTSNYSVYLRDNWIVTKNVTLNLGLRWEHSRMNMWYRDEIPEWMTVISPTIRDDIMLDESALAPRLGLTYNWENIGVFKFHWGRYLEHVGGSAGQYPRVIGFNTWRMRSSDFGKGPEALYLYSEGTLNYSPNHTDNLEIEHDDEFIASFERELFWNLAFETSFIYRKTYPLTQPEINAIYENGQFVGRKFPEFDNILVKTTLKGDDRVADWIYKGLQFNLKRNFVGRWGLMLNYTLMWRDYRRLKWAQGEIEQFVYANPDDLSMDRYGARWTFKASFFYRLPWDIAFATFVWGQSGVWMNDITGDWEWNDDAPRVTLSNGRRVSDIVWQANNSYYVGRKYGLQGRMTDQLWTVNLRLSKGINISRFRAEFSVDFYNLFNTATYTSWATLDVRHPQYDEKRNPQTPRSAQINVRLKF